MIGFLLLIPLVFSLTTQADPRERLVQRYYQTRASFEADRYGEIRLETPSTLAWYDQKIDHFSSASGTFRQRYFVDSTFARDSKSPVIYYICGESTCEGPTSTPLVNRLARKLRAHRVALEHRYYGQSQPFAALTPENLRYLSLDQALEDLAEFQKFAQSRLKLEGKWIAVGGSYPGELSAFYRMRHPDLVVGALASSAPVHAKADFFEYDRHVARVADPACLKVIQSVVGEVEDRLKSDAQRREVKKLFQASRVQNDVDFLYTLADMAAVAIQYGFQEEFCSALVSGARNGKAVEAYARVGNSLFERLGTNPFMDSFEGALSTDPKDYLDYAGRQWMYQSCTEFGFYQIANSVRGETARSSRIDLAYHHAACNRLFGLVDPVNTDATNRDFEAHLLDAGVKNIVFTNGANDPWSNLSFTDAGMTQTANPGLTVLLIPGASHCEDLGSRLTQALEQARSVFEREVGKWL